MLLAFGFIALQDLRAQGAQQKHPIYEEDDSGVFAETWDGDSAPMVC